MAFADPALPPPDWAAGEGGASAELVDTARSRPDRRRGAAHPRSGRTPPPPPDPESDPRTRGTDPDPVDWARQIALRALTAAPRSRAQLEDVLRRKGCADDIAATVLDRLTEVGLVDDAAYAGMLVRSRQAGRGLARRALAQELQRKGIDDDTARAALDEVDPVAEEDRARDLAAKKMRTMSGLDPTVQTRRLAGMLARKGYSVDVVRRVVRDAIRDAPEHARD